MQANEHASARAFLLDRVTAGEGWELPEPRAAVSLDTAAAAMLAFARQAPDPSAAVEAEREACEEVAERPGFVQARDTEWDEGFNYAKRLIAAAIRQRKEVA